MKNRLRLAAVALFAGAIGIALPTIAVDPPHWAGVGFQESCESSCHALHSSAGGTLTQAAGNVNLCIACHNPVGNAKDLPFNTVDVAIPGSGGTSHAFDVPTTKAEAGATPPTTSSLLLRVMDNKVVCSTCHDQHASTSANGGTSRIGKTVKRVSTGGTGTVASGGTFTGSAGKWYLIEIQTAGSQSTATFRWSNDSGTSWMVQNVPAGNGANVALSDGVSVAFSGAGGTAFNALERWEFSASWPFLREALDSGTNAGGTKFCRDCHAAWAQDHSDQRTYTGSYKSHPVGITLDANGEGYDRAAPLDANGLPQAGDRDGDPGNDLLLDSGGAVQCLSCHGMHHTDSNTTSPDRR